MEAKNRYKIKKKLKIAMWDIEAGNLGEDPENKWG